MRNFKLELKVKDNNTLTWQICLGSVTAENIQKQWKNPSPGNYTKVYDSTHAENDKLHVFISCSGYGASAIIEVIIDGESRGTITANYNDSAPATKTFAV